MEGSGGKRRSGSHVDKAGSARAGRYKSRKGGILKRKHRKIAEECASAKTSRRGNNGKEEVSINGLQSETKRRKRQRSALVSDNNVECKESECPKRACNLDRLNGVTPDGGDGAPDQDGADALPCRTSQVPELCSCLEGGLVIPKRPRGASRRKKSERLLTPKRAAAGLSDFLSTIEADAQNGNVAEPVLPAVSGRIKKKKVVDDLVNGPPGRIGKRIAAVVGLLAKDEETEDKITDKKITRRRKRMSPISRNTSQIENDANLVRECENSEHHPDEEESLEHYAARMLSSRFDPRCTDTLDVGPDSENPASTPQASRRRSSLSSSSAADATGRLLRPRRQDFQGFVKKRRHFYEVHASDMDSYWLLEKKIKVFCPLDHGWCFGSVKDYSPDSGMHLIKYEGRDEEWADLQKERIKVLLFHSELCGDSQRISAEVKPDHDEQVQPVTSDTSLNSLMDSEPIISYYTRLVQKIKRSTLTTSKKRFRPDKSLVSAGASLFRLKKEILPTNGNSYEGVNTKTVELSMATTKNALLDRRFSFMYSRKRVCKVKRESENITKDCWRSFDFSVPTRRSFNIAFNLMKLEQGRLKLMLHPLCLLSLVEGHPYYRKLLFFQDYTLTALWPVVHMEIVIVEKPARWRFISLEGCLGHIVAVLCLIMRISQWSTDYTDCSKIQMPFALISCKLSGMRDSTRHPIFMFISLDQECLNWDYLKHKLDNFHFLITRQVSFSDCNSATIRRFLGDADLVRYTSRMVPLEIYSVACIQVQENHGKVTDGSSSVADDSSDQVSEITLENTGSSQSHTAEIPSCALSKVGRDVASLSSDDEWKRTQNFVKNGPGTNETSGRLTSSKRFLRSQRQPRRAAWNSYSQFVDSFSSPDKSDDGTHSHSEVVLARKRACREEHDAGLSNSNLSWKISQDHDLQSPGNKGFGIIQNPVSPDFSCFSENYSAGSLKNDYINQYRKPRTEVQYSLPHVRYDSWSRSKSHKRRGHPSKKLKYDRSKYSKVSSKSSRYSKSLTCEANVLITDVDRGWREHGAVIVLESEGQSWKLLVKFSGNTKYSYKADQFIQPGSTNRFTHAMMWKGGTNWALEFTDRNQWAAFKEMHEECYNRNIRAASVKNIPIPGVRLIEDDNSYISSAPFARGLQYFNQVGNEVDLAMDPSHVVYDMDSDDEEFVSKLRNMEDSDESKRLEISDELFEKVIDILEKFSYSQKRDELSEPEIERLFAEIGISSVIWSIHEHWRAKRKRKRVALIRQFQPALWEQYQMKVKEWEEAASQTTYSNVQQQKKPAMFAFCLKPRRLKVPPKNSNQRPHKKLSHQNSYQREQDRTHGSGRKLNKLSDCNDDASVSVPDHNRFYQHSPLPWNGYSPCRTNISEAKGRDKSEKIQHLTLHGSNPKKMGLVQSNRDHRVMEIVYDQTANNDKFYMWNAGLPECSNTRKIHSEGIQNRSAEIEEFRLRDASNAAQHASNMAKLKREKAQWLLRKADLAVHKATVALMTAEAIKASSEDLIGDG